MPVQDVLIRLLEPGDVAACVRLYQEAYQAPPYGHGWDDAAARRIVEDLLRLFPRESFVAERGGKVVGFILCSSLAGLRATIEEFAVAPEYQRHGIGRRLLKHVIQHYRDRQVPFLELVANIDAPAWAFYLGEGFTENKTYRLMSKEL